MIEAPPAFHLRGVLLPEGEHRDLWIADGLISHEPVRAAQTLHEGGYLLPGLVDAHCHVGLGPNGAVELPEAIDQARTDRDAGALLLRDCGSPLDTRPLQERSDLPRIIRAGRHLSRPKRYIPYISAELEHEELLPAAMAEQAANGDGWVKIVGDWIDRGTGDLAPLWSDRILTEAIAAAHAAGARVTAHVFSEDAVPGLVNAGIDCIEHGTGLTGDTIAEMARRGTALVPTLINIELFPGIAAKAGKYPRYAEHMLDLHARCADTMAAAIEAGVPVYAGTDAGGGIKHGRIADEITALHRVGMSREAAIGAASWAAREWLGRPALTHGAPADLVVYAEDPRADLGVLRTPELVVLGGHPYT
ncbi:MULTISPECIES: amidohydrolase family protein [unclassified Crossiella]|uniref:amidohydrolase family protein n=1 Tax=unclassified Crossiella TaxID=2620835 RepID=UPI001FFE31F9|nr:MULTISPECIES: amidohydrolase family protein [unclassified Crossiella]MCK2242443.1 amidohydrolase family protein [Crossiella sp. S99.2]MCK2254526.1 amidohydrolase family protein [Crossiella sp. S99.1]